MSDLAERLEMYLVLRWLDAGERERAEVTVPLAEAAESLGLGGARSDLLGVMGALGELEDRGKVRVSRPGGAAAEVRVALDEALRRDAERLFRR